jgi:hypothetical protein
MQQMNRCHLYLKVSTLSDITTGDGRFITVLAAKGLKDDTYLGYHRWPNQGRPNKKIWAKWRSNLPIILCG